MDFACVVHEKRYLFDPNLFPAESGLVVGGVVVYFNATHEAFLEFFFLLFNFSGDVFALATHGINRFLKEYVMRRGSVNVLLLSCFSYELECLRYRRYKDDKDVS